MNLDEIKAARAIGEIAYSNELEWLIAEVKQLRDEITRLNHVAIHKAYNDGVLYAANLCADKVNFYHPNGQALEAIMKEFGLYEP